MGADSGCWRLMGVALKNRGGHDRIRNGSVAEWLKAHDSKSCGLATVSEVRILSLPPKRKESTMQTFLRSARSNNKEEKDYANSYVNTPKVAWAH